jgi:acyl-coenzyme A synthetase/AMP-(fatty) acid ligase
MQYRLIEAFYKTAMQFPDKIALITERSQMSFKDVLALTHVLDIHLKTRGVREEQTLVVDTNRGELCIAFSLLLSLRSLTVIFAPIELVARRGVHFDWLVTAEMKEGVAADRQIVMEADWFSIIGTLPVPQYENLPGKGGAFVTQTSGTTGVPKLVRLPEASRMRDMISMVTHSAEQMRSMRFMITAGPSTGWAMNKNLPVLLGGGSVVSLGDDMTRMLAYSDLWRVSHLAVTPAVLQQALRLSDAGQFLTAAKEIEVGGAFAPPGLLDAVAQACPATLITAYGATEVGALTRRKYSATDSFVDGYLGDLFRDDLDLVFMDDDLREMPEANEGILAVRISHEAQRSYLLGSDESEDSAGLLGDLFVTGDIVRKDGHALYLTGRRKRVLNLNGNKYSLDLIQALLMQHFPEQSEVVVVATQDHDGLEQLVVFYCSQDDIPESEIEAILKNQWQKISLGKAVAVPHMPMTASGKVDLAALRDLMISRP